jgi:hypothetical protein
VLDIIDYPNHGTARLWADKIGYVRQDTLATEVLRDSLTYRVCRDQTCATAKVWIAIE